MNNDKIIQLRPATESDAPAILKIYNEVVANTTAIYEDTPRTLDEQVAWLQSKRQSGFPIFVALEAGVVVGYSGYGPFRQWKCYRHTVELGLHVSAESRGRGVGTLMLKNLIEDARERDFHVMIAGIDADNDVSLKLHEKFGFRRVAELPEVGRKFDRWLDLVFMQLIVTKDGV